MASTRTPRGPGAARPGSAGAFTSALGEAFLALVGQTGNYRAASRTLGHPHLFRNRMRRDPGFRRLCEAAAAAADARLRAAESPVLPPIEIKSMPPDGPPEKPRPAEPEPVIRRAGNGRLQIGHVPEGGVTAAAEAEFLALLRETGNFDGSAHATGFWPSTFYRRRDEWPAFARDCREALEQAGVRLEYRLIAHAHASLRRPGDGEPGEAEAGAGVPFDPEAAMRILSFLDRRKAGRTGGRHKGAPDRSFEEVLDSILTKIEAIDRHEKKYGKKGDEDGGGSG